jgi:NADH-ubiquinone oxidoreductase chain 6
MVYNLIDKSSLDFYLITLTDFNNGFNINYLELLGFLSIISSVLVISSRNPIVSVLFLIALFLNISIYLIMVGLTFIGLSYLLVYIGAISMLFLFILMLIDIRISELHVENSNSLFLAFLVGILFYFILNNIIPYNIYKTNYIKSNLLENNIVNIMSNTWDGNMIENYDIISIGNLLYTNFSIWLIIASLILLLAMVGSIIININQETLV